ncbi:MAG: PepSY domain-containing protein [Pseudomonadales bacterium]|nr:PepSY domain-containing protein [Pseudomonadales bacterium]
MKSYALTSRLLGLALLMVLGTPALDAQTLLLAQAPADGASAEAPRVSQRQALELVRARFPGNVVSINQVQQGGVLQYRVRMDNEGNIYTVYVNASTGAITREP